MSFGSINITFEENSFINQIGMSQRLYSESIPARLADYVPLSYFSELQVPMIRVTLPTAGDDPYKKHFEANFNDNFFSATFFV